MATDVILGRTIVFAVTPAKEVVGLRLSPVGVVEEKEKMQVIHDLTFGGGVLYGRKGGE